MKIGLLQVEFHMPFPQSLKDKRKITRSIMVKLRSKHNISLAETGYQDKWQRCLLSAVCVANGSKMAHAQLEKILRELEKERDIVVVNQTLEIF